MKNKLVHSPWVVGIAILLVLGGMAIQMEIYKRAPRKVTMTIVERPFALPPKIEWRQAETVPPETLIVEQFITDANRDSLARAALSVKKTTFVDTVAYSDSLGSFTVEAVHELTFDGVLNEFRKRTTYSEGKLTTVNRTDTVYLKPSYIEALAEIILNPLSWLIAGVVILSTFL